MELDEATAILKDLQNKSISEIAKKYSENELADALNICYSKDRSLVNESIDKAIEVYTLCGRILTIKALLLLSEKREQDALNLLSLVPHDDEYFLSCLELIGMIFMNNYQFERGIQTFDAILTQADSPKNQSFVYQQRSICNQYLGNFTEALTDSMKAAQLFYVEEEFFKEVLMNLRLCITNKSLSEIKVSVKEFEKFCYETMEEYYVYGPYLFLMELEFLRRNYPKTAELYTDFGESELNDFVKEFESRFEEMKTFSVLLEKFDEVKTKIDAIPKPREPNSIRSGKPVITMSDFETAVTKYVDQKELFQKELDKIKKKLCKLNQEDFDIFEALSGDQI